MAYVASFFFNILTDPTRIVRHCRLFLMDGEKDRNKNQEK